MLCSGWLRGRGFGLILGCIFGSLLIIRAMPAEAGPARATMADIQCLVIGARLAASSDQRRRLTGTMLAIYFLGRVDGRSPTVDLQALLKEEAKKMTAPELSSAMHRCGIEFSKRGPELVRIGKTLEQIGK